MIQLTDNEKTRLEQWIIENIHPDWVPADDGNTDGLAYNLIMAIRGSDERYEYKDEQDAEIEALFTPQSLQTMRPDEPIGFTYLVTYAVHSGLTGEYKYGNTVTDDVAAWINEEPNDFHWINVQEITLQQAQELET